MNIGSKHLILLAFVLLALPWRAGAQTSSTGQVRVSVTDQTGGAIVGAAVTLDNGTSRRSALTDGQGRYVFDQIPPGSYTLTVDSPGFLTATEPVKLRGDAVVTRAINLKVAVTVSVDVTEPAGLSTDPRRSLSSITLSKEDIKALPDDPRMFQRRLMELAGSTGARGDVAVFVDGFRDFKRLPPKSVIDSIRINSNPFSAEYFQQSLKRIEITTSPGTDSFHGDTAVSARMNKLDAPNPLSQETPEGDYRNLNGYLQGPLKKERAGFLFYAGRWQQDDNATVHATVLNPATGLTQPFSSTFLAPTTETSATFKVDFKVLNQTINTSYARTDNTFLNQGLDSGFDLPERAYDRTSSDDVARVWWVGTRPRSLNEFRFELTRSGDSSKPRTQAPAVLVLDAFNAGGSQAATQSTTVGALMSDTFTVVRGTHTLKTGAHVETTAVNALDRTGFGGTFTFGTGVERDAEGQPVVSESGQQIPISPIESYQRTVEGLPGYGPSQFAITTGDPAVSVMQWSGGWFVLDDWLINKRFSLSYGLRQEIQNNIAMRLNLAPRAFLSWLLDEKGKSALKLGAGVFYAPVDSGITSTTQKLDGTHQQQIIVANPSFFSAIPSLTDLDTKVGSAIYTKSADLQMPYSFITTTSFERQLPHGLFATAQYLFNRGYELIRLRDTNAPLPGSTGTAASPILQFESTGRSVQHELRVSLNGSVGTRATWFGTYKIGRNYTDTDGPYTVPANSHDLSIEYGPAATDRRHQITAGASAQLVRGLSFSSALTISSGVPFNITTGRDNNGDTLFTDRPAFANPGDPGAITTHFGVFNPNPKPGDVIIPRNFGREPWQVNVDLGVSKSLGKGLSLTMNAANLLNADHLLALNGVLSSPVFGMPNQALNGRRLELTLRYGF